MTTQTIQCADLNGDRDMGDFWERQFCFLAAQYGRCFTRHQFKRKAAATAVYPITGGLYKAIVLPDITVWSAPGEHHEIKHKAPTKHGTFGLERYRLDSLLKFADETKQPVQYTIHDHSRCGGRNAQVNRLGDWITADVRALANSIDFVGNGPSYVNGEQRKVEICYWDSCKWIPLADFWA